MYQYKATVLRITDGDTVYLIIDLGMHTFVKFSCRLAGINAPELRSEDETTRAKAKLSKEYLATLLPIDSSIIIDSRKLDKYDRPLIVITTEAGLNINDEMVAQGHAVVYK